jgi:hypothetical protein
MTGTQGAGNQFQGFGELLGERARRLLRLKYRIPKGTRAEDSAQRSEVDRRAGTAEAGRIPFRHQGQRDQTNLPGDIDVGLLEEGPHVEEPQTNSSTKFGTSLSGDDSKLASLLPASRRAAAAPVRMSSRFSMTSSARRAGGRRPIPAGHERGAHAGGHAKWPAGAAGFVDAFLDVR